MRIAWFASAAAINDLDLNLIRNENHLKNLFCQNPIFGLKIYRQLPTILFPTTEAVLGALVIHEFENFIYVPTYNRYSSHVSLHMAALDRVI